MPGRGELDLIFVGEFGGTKQDRKSLTVRAQRDRGVSVKAGIVCPVATSRTTPIGLGIAPGGDDTAALYLISNAIHKADHEARGITEIVSKGRPKRCARRNRIARANKLGAALSHARLQTCDAASIATKTLGRLAECRASISEILTRLGVCGNTLSMGVKKARQFRRVLVGPSACLSLVTFCLPREWVNIGCSISDAARLPRCITQKNKGVSWS